MDYELHQLHHYVTFMYALINCVDPERLPIHLAVLRNNYARSFPDDSIPQHLRTETYQGTTNITSNFYQRGILVCSCNRCARSRMLRMTYNSLAHTADCISNPPATSPPA